MTQFYCIFADMDQKLFADIIKEVLVRDNIACLPGLGAFVTREVPAFFSHKGFVINPPYLKLDFDPQIKDNTALVEFYSESNNISLSRAKAIVGEYVQGLASEMYAARFVELPGLGRLRVTRSNDVFFVADEELSIFPHYDCLEPVSLRYLPVSESVAVPEAPVAESEVAPGPESLVEAEAQAEVAAEVQSGSAETHDEPAVEPAQEPVAAPSPEPEAAPQTEPESPEVQVPQGETLAEPEETVVPVETVVPDEPAVEPAQAPEAVPVAAPSPQPGAAPEPESEPAPAPAPKPGLSGFGIFYIVVLVLALLFFVALAVLGRTYPELVDPYLYTPEELKILNTRL